MVNANLKQVYGAWPKTFALKHLLEPRIEYFPEWRDLLIDLRAWDRQFLKQPHPLVSKRVKERPWRREDSACLQQVYQCLTEMYPQKDSATVGWGSDWFHDYTFHDICQIGDLRGKRCLDIGCGQGALLSRLARDNIQLASYVGIDVNPQFLKKARQRYPEATFLSGDCFDLKASFYKVIESGKLGDFDYVFANGLFSFRPKTWTKSQYHALILRVVRRLFEISNIGLSLTLNPEIQHMPKWKKGITIEIEKELVSFSRFNFVNRMPFVYSCSQWGQGSPRIETLPINMRRIQDLTPFFLYH